MLKALQQLHPPTSITATSALPSDSLCVKQAVQLLGASCADCRLSFLCVCLCLCGPLCGPL